MLTWNIFVIIMSVTSLTLVNVNSSGRNEHPDTTSSANVNPSDEPSSSLPDADNNLSKIILYDPFKQQHFPMKYNNYNPLIDMEFGSICYTQIRMFCDDEPDDSQSSNCIRKAILFYKNNLLLLTAENVYEYLSNDVLQFFETFPMNADKVVLPSLFCRRQANVWIRNQPEYEQIHVFTNVVWRDKNTYVDWCLAVLQDYQAFIPQPSSMAKINTVKIEIDSNEARRSIAKYALNNKTVIGIQAEGAELPIEVTNLRLSYIDSIANAVRSISDQHNPRDYCTEIQNKIDSGVQAREQVRRQVRK